MTIIQFIQQLKAADTLEKANKALRLYLNGFGIHSYAFTYYSLHPSSRRKLKYELASKPLQAWHQHYLESGYEDIDQTLREAHKNILPVFWDITEQLREACTPAHFNFRSSMISFFPSTLTSAR